MKAIVLAGGIPQIQLIKKLQKRGYFVILIDYTEHPIAEKYADKFCRVSTLDLDAVRSVAISEKVDLVFTVCTDQALNTVATISEELKLPCYIGSQTGRNVTNKRYMKSVFAEHGIPTAKFQIMQNGEHSVSKDLKYPLIVKPVDCNSSKGVAKVLNDDDLHQALDQAYQYSRTHDAIVEEFIDGREISVDIYVHHGHPQILCVSESEKAKINGKFIIYRAVVPAGIDEDAYCQIESIAQKIVTAFGLNDCPMLIQTLYKDGKVNVIEFSARTGGALKYRLIQQNSGVDIIDCAIDATLGKSCTLTPSYLHKYIVNEFIYTTGGIFDHLEGFDELIEDHTIHSYFPFKTKGTVFDKEICSSGDRAVGYTIIADTYEELVEKHKKANASVKVIDSCGKDIMCHGISYPINARPIPKHNI